jgi:hypothetical protein
MFVKMARGIHERSQKVWPFRAHRTALLYRHLEVEKYTGGFNGGGEGKNEKQEEPNGLYTESDTPRCRQAFCRNRTRTVGVGATV